MLRIGVLGAGHLGKIHIQQLKEIPEFQLVGFYDLSEDVRNSVENQFGVKAYADLKELINICDVVDVVTPTLSHFECASEAIRSSKHVFIEKPLANSPQEGQQLASLAREAGVKVQVGHVERFNPAFIATREYIKSPMFIETHRLAQFNPRGTDVSVVLDLMIHDLDIILSLVKSTVKRIHASGVAVVSDTPDIANARIEFDNGCVANLTASRISLKNMRKSRFFQKDAYISVDFLEKKSEVVRLKTVKPPIDPFAFTIDLGPEKGVKQIMFDNPAVNTTNAIREELSSFAKSILGNTEPLVTLEDGLIALETAHTIVEKLKSNNNNQEGIVQP
ncbi:MAG: Gfo/Idh/MocA family protein [Bacteroidota bacterium]|jgi:predicted dehydrogenase